MEEVFLRALGSDDIENCLRWHNDQELNRFLLGTFHYVNRDTEMNWLKKVQTPSNQDVNLAICLSDNGQHVGNIYIRDIDWIFRRGELHVLIGEQEHRGKGYGEAAVRLLIRYAFDSLGLHRIYLLVLENNQAAIRMYSRCGFEREGVLKHHGFKNGKFQNVLIMGLTNSAE
jgi:RimJ/RimL family protein N-acetyltransferase